MSLPLRTIIPAGAGSGKTYRIQKSLAAWVNDGLVAPERIARRLEPGAIILLHDGNIPAERLVVTVKTLLETVRSLGYEVVRLDRMLT